MIRLAKISCLITYIFFTQISPFIHWHVHEHQGEMDFQLSVHPPEFPLENHAHDDHHDGTDEHQHQDTHLDTEQDYTLQVKTLSITATEHTIQIINISDNHKPFILTPLDIPFKVPRHYLAASLPDRAPPRFI
jgi:hypothetical protein